MNKYQVMPDLSEEEYQALKESIRERGVLEPIVMDDEGNIIDGHHRMQIVKELEAQGIDVRWETQVRVGLTEQQKIEEAYTRNTHRRELSKQWKQERAAELRQEGWTQERIGRVLGVPRPTVTRWLNQFVQMNKLSQPETIVGADGKSYPATRPSRERKFSPEEALEKAKELRSRGLDQETIAKHVGVNQATVSRWFSQEREREQERERQLAALTPITPEEIEVPGLAPPPLPDFCDEGDYNWICFWCGHYERREATGKSPEPGGGEPFCRQVGRFIDTGLGNDHQRPVRNCPHWTERQDLKSSPAEDASSDEIPGLKHPGKKAGDYSDEGTLLKDCRQCSNFDAAKGNWCYENGLVIEDDEFVCDCMLYTEGERTGIFEPEPPASAPTETSETDQASAEQASDMTASDMSVEEIQRLVTLESEIDEGLQRLESSFREIRSNRLYRESYSNFEEYRIERWSYTYSLVMEEG